MIKASSLFGLIIVALSLWAGDALACSSEFCPNDPSAIHMDGSNGNGYLTTSSIYNVQDSNTFFMSTWYRTTTNSAFLLNAHSDVTGCDYVTVSYLPYAGVGPNTALTVSVTTAADCSAGVTFTTSASFSLPIDGQWHNLIVSVDAAAESGSYAVDGAVNFFVLGGGTNTPGNVNWSAAKVWEIGEISGGVGSPYTGDLAEFYINLSPSIGSASGLVSKFYSSGKAPGLGANCTSPTGSAPNMCQRGDPCNFIFGPRPNAAPAYVLKAPQGASQPLPNGADTDPCLTDGKGQGCAPNK